MLKGWRVQVMDALDEDDHEVVLDDRASVDEPAEPDVEDREPLSPEQWIENPYFSGTMARDMYDVLKEDFADVFGRNVFEVNMLGAIGWGKTSAALVVQAYSMYLLTCYAVPQRQFRKMFEQANIMYMSINITKEKAKSSYFSILNQYVKSIPYFQQDGDCPIQKNLVNEIRVPSKRLLCTYSGAVKTAAESENLIFLTMDEPNFYDVVERSRRATTGERYDAAEEIDNSAVRRMQTRYMLRDGSMPLPCKVLRLCRETYPDSFMRRKKAVSLKTDGRSLSDVERGRTKNMDYSEWATKPHLYDKTYFWIRTGTRTTGPQVIEKEEDAVVERQALERAKAGGRPADELWDVVRAPLAGGEYLRQARADLPKFIREVCGMPTEALTMYFDRREPIFAAVRKPGPDVPAEVCAHPFSELTTNLFDGVFLVKERLARQGGDGRWRPIVNPRTQRFVHVDAGLTGDALGLAMCHVSGWREVPRFGVGGSVSTEKMPVIWFDLLLRVEPPPGGEIPFAGVRGILRSLMELGYRFTLTRDTFHSSWTQELPRSMKTELVSVDRTTDAYDCLRLAYREGRVSAYEYPPLEDELTGLELVRTGQVRDGRQVEKVDHGPHGSKDVSDSAAGSGWSATQSFLPGVSGRTAAAIRGTANVETVGEREHAKKKLFEEGKWDELYRMMRREEDGL